MKHGPTYRIADDDSSITCLKCNRTSFNPQDVLSHYCGYCHEFHDDNIQQVEQVLGKGIWIDGNGQGHFNIPQVLEAVGLPNTPENHAIAVEALRQLGEKHGMMTLYRKSDKDPGFKL